MTRPASYHGNWYWIATAVAGLSVVLVAFNIALGLSSEATQAKINERQQFIDQTAQIDRANAALVRALATTAVSTGDAELHQILTDHGIAIAPSAPATGAALPPAKRE